jgi:hypothetical protein
MFVPFDVDAGNIRLRGPSVRTDAFLGSHTCGSPTLMLNRRDGSRVPDEDSGPYWALADARREAPWFGPKTTTVAPVFTRL